MKSFSSLVVVLACASACAGTPPAEEQPPTETPAVETPEPAKEAPVDPLVERGRRATTMFYDGQDAALHARFSAEMLAALPAEQWAAFVAKIKADLGAEVELVDESTSRLLDNLMYRRTATFEKAPGTQLILTWAFRKDGTITGFNILPPQKPADTPHLEYQTKSSVRLPFEGEWTVVWGGRTVEQNYHAATVGQRFALDLLVTDADGLSYQGDRTKNESYYAFGKKVLAPAAGKVIAVENRTPDNIPGEMNPKKLAGNHVLIDHGNGEYSLLAHFKQGSVVVKVGDKVAQGDLLGLCGNTGNSSEPHLHYHLQNVAKVLGGEGLPIQFEAAVVDGERHERVEIEQGQRVQPVEE